VLDPRRSRLFDRCHSRQRYPHRRRYFCGALLTAALAFRPRAKPVPGALCSRPADLLTDGGKKLPGQLSISSTGVTWVPNDYSVARGAREWSASATDGLHLSLQRGSALLDLILTPRQSRRRTYADS
jgi:hypothetical protein